MTTSVFCINLIRKFEKPDARLILDIDEFLQKNITQDLAQCQIDALGSIIHSIGVDAFKASPLFNIINSDPNSPKVSDYWEIWDKSPNGIETPQLFDRRKEELEMYYYNC